MSPNISPAFLPPRRGLGVLQMRGDRIYLELLARQLEIDASILSDNVRNDFLLVLQRLTSLRLMDIENKL